MDNNTITIMKDYEESISLSFQKIDKSLKEFTEADQAQQRNLEFEIKCETYKVKTFIGLMKVEWANLNETIYKDKWEKIIFKLNSKCDEYKKQFNQMINQDIHPMNEYMRQNEKICWC